MTFHDNKMSDDISSNQAGRNRQYRTISKYKLINKMILSECNDQVSNKIRGKLQTTSSQFALRSVSIPRSFNLTLARRLLPSTIHSPLFHS